MDEDWDDYNEVQYPKNPTPQFRDNDYSHSRPEPTSKPGKTFGSRGRGFKRADEPSDSYNRVGNNRDDFYNNRNNGHRNEQEEPDWKPKSGGWGGSGPGRGPRDFGGPKGNPADRPKPKSTYIPDAPTENEDEIFGNQISSGINFDKYDDIKVSVSGENAPQPIFTFDRAGLRPHLVDIIRRCNYKKPTPIQKYSIPIVLGGRDMMACAQTGSGKTAAFLIPIINNLLENNAGSNMGSLCRPQVLVVSPTRELTIQIFEEARKFSLGTYLKVAIAYGGTSVHHQMERIKHGCHILVATPGRLIDFVGRNLIEFTETRYLVLDEADRMLNMGFLSEMKQIVNHPSMMPAGERHTLMFSATFPDDVQRLAEEFLYDYLFVAVGIVGGACSDVDQKFYLVTKFEKRNKLVEILNESKHTKSLVFVEQKRTTDFIATFLCEKNFPATSIHGDREQREREEALRDFKSGRMDVLVATSVASRGLDIKNVGHVINYDLPSSIDDYVHRIGRTGRVGNRGCATSFFDPSADAQLAPSLVRILRQAGQEVPEFLAQYENSGVCETVPMDFGGSDYRKNMGLAKEDVFEDDQW